MANIKLTNKQLRLIQIALDLYSRVGILQLDEILSHPTINDIISDQFREKSTLVVGDNTERGKIVEIGDGFIKTEGSWGNGTEIKTWTDIENIKLSTDWTKVHETRDKIRKKLSEIKCLITGDGIFYHSDLGIYGNSVDSSCREAYDMIQYIRHEFWKEQPDKSFATIDSSITKSCLDDEIVVKLDTIQEKRKRKITNINKK